MREIFGVDAYSPQEIAERVEAIGVAKARLPLLAMAMLGVLAGAFIGLGALYYTLVVSDASLGFALARVLGGIVFSMGLVLVVVAGAELFTGNNLLTMAWADGRIRTRELLGNWLVVYLANAAGAAGLALLVVLADHGAMNQGRVALQAVAIAANKAAMPFASAFFKGVLCNALVCLAVWLAMAGRSLTDKVFAIVFPISAFVAAGFEHSVANMYFIPLGIAWKGVVAAEAIAHIDALTWSGLVHNLLAVTLGNVVGGAVLVALVYYLIYGRALRSTE